MKKEEGRVESRGEGNETEGSSGFELLSLSLSLSSRKEVVGLVGG